LGFVPQPNLRKSDILLEKILRYRKKSAFDGKVKSSPYLIKIGKASQILSDDSCFLYFEETKDAAQPKAKIVVGLFTKPSNFIWLIL